MAAAHKSKNWTTSSKMSINHSRSKEEEEWGKQEHEHKHDLLLGSSPVSVPVMSVMALLQLISKQVKKQKAS
jgi:hypothetical protein